MLVIGGICLLSLGGLSWWSASCQLNTRQQNNDVAGFIYAALGVIYAVLIALVVIAVWEEFQAASETVEQGPTPWPRSPGWPIEFPSQRSLHPGTRPLLCSGGRRQRVAPDGAGANP